MNHEYMGSTEVPPAARQGPEDIREINREQINIRLEHKNSDSPVLSAYVLPRTNVKVWIITEWDRSVTTVLLPDEY